MDLFTMSTETLINTTKFLLIEDNWRLRDALIHALTHVSELQEEGEKQQTEVPEFEHVASADNGEDALRYLKTREIDLVIMDYALKDHSLWGVELTREIRIRFPSKKILFWSAYIREVDLNHAKRAGADGYVSKDKSDRDVIDAIRKVMQGEKIWEQESVVKNDICLLSSTEKEVLKFLAEGKSNTEIAYSLLEKRYLEVIDEHGSEYVIKKYGSLRKYIDLENLSSHTKTVQKHFEHIRSKIGIRNRLELFRLSYNNFASKERDRKIPELDLKVMTLHHEERTPSEVAKELLITEKKVREILNKYKL